MPSFAATQPATLAEAAAIAAALEQFRRDTAPPPPPAAALPSPWQRAALLEATGAPETPWG